jgi:CheY-like chemotaxis protein
MPEVGGITLLRMLRKSGIVIPFILITGHPLQEELEKLRAEGLSTWMLKPPRVKQLAQVISKVLSQMN